jgi:hypothetical protein
LNIVIGDILAFLPVVAMPPVSFATIGRRGAWRRDAHHTNADWTLAAVSYIPALTIY